jgi:hypothetical protein
MNARSYFPFGTEFAVIIFTSVVEVTTPRNWRGYFDNEIRSSRMSGV